MEGLRAQARERFLKKQRFKQDTDLYKLQIPFITIGKFGTETTVSERNIPWLSSKGLCKQFEQPVANHKNEPASATLKLLKIDRDTDGVLWIDQQLFMNIFDEIGFDMYWLHLILRSVYGFFSQRSRSGTLHTYYLHTVCYTLIWAYDLREGPITAKAIMMLRRYDHQPLLYNSFVRSMIYNKDKINDVRFCSFVCATELVHWIEDSVDENLIRIRRIEAQTEHGPWREAGEARHPPDTDELIRRSKETGTTLTALANVVRHASIAKTILDDLSSYRPLSKPLPSIQSMDAKSTVSTPSIIKISLVHNSASPPPAPTPAKVTETAMIVDGILAAIDFLRGQIKSGECQASYLQERARTQHSVIFNTLTRHDAESSAKIARAAQKDS